MDLMRKTLTRRNALIGSTAGLGLAALGWLARSAHPAAHPQAWASEAPGSTLTAAETAAAPTATQAAVEAAADAPAGAPAASASATAAAAAAAANTPPPSPVGGAGLYDVDPDQSGVNQDPHVEVTSDIAALPLDMEF
jgi:hypothetical protein